MAFTLMQAVQRAADRLDAAGVAFGQGTTNAFDEAAWLVLWRLGLPLDALDDEADSPLSAKAQGEVGALIEQRIHTRQPAAYLTGEAWLQGPVILAWPGVTGSGGWDAYNLVIHELAHKLDMLDGEADDQRSDSCRHGVSLPLVRT